MDPPINRQIAAARKAAGLTQAQLAERIGLPQTRVSEMERGARPVTIPRLCAIAGALGLSFIADADGARLVDSTEIGGG